jgi:hypothetical protein
MIIYALIVSNLAFEDSKLVLLWAWSSECVEWLLPEKLFQPQCVPTLYRVRHNRHKIKIRHTTKFV